MNAGTLLKRSWTPLAMLALSVEQVRCRMPSLLVRTVAQVFAAAVSG